MKNLTLTDFVTIAKYETQKAATVKMWRLTNKKERLARFLAVATAARKGYIIASVSQMKRMYPNYISGKDSDRLHVWGWKANECRTPSGKILCKIRPFIAY